MDEIELKYTLDEYSHNILKTRFKSSIKMVTDEENFIFVLGDNNIIRLREKKYKGSKTHYLTYKQSDSRSPKVMLRIENDVEIAAETYNALMGIFPTPTFTYETNRHWWDGHFGEKCQLDKFKFSNGTFYLYEMEIEFEDIKDCAKIELKTEALFKSLGIEYHKNIISKYDRYKDEIIKRNK